MWVDEGVGIPKAADGGGSVFVFFFFSWCGVAREGIMYYAYAILNEVERMEMRFGLSKRSCVEKKY